MYISETYLRNESGSVRAEAQVTWEEADRPPVTLFFETDDQFQDAFWPDPNGFLIASILPAWHAGEKRVKIDEALCPVLCSNLNSAMTMLEAWYPELGRPLTIEPSHGFKAIPPFQAQSASLLSCGIDSLATVRWNKMNLPSDHPASIKGLIPVCFPREIGLTEEETSNRTRKRIASASRVGADVGTYSIPIMTNILELDGDGWFFNYKWHSAVFIAAAYFVSRCFNKFYIAASDDAAHFIHWGSNPLLDSWYSSGHVQIEHHGMSMSRFEKTKLVSEWPAGLQNILVCQGRDSGQSNCGKCEKCIRTMVMLEALGKLRECSSFPIDEISPELLNTLEEYNMGYRSKYYNLLKPLLAERGRNDLVTAIEQIAARRAERPSERILVERRIEELIPPVLTEQDIEELIPAGSTFIRAGERRCESVISAGRNVLRWGTPWNDSIAVHQLGTLRQAGGEFLVIGEPLFWWLERYKNLHQHLREQFTCIAENHRFIIFDLRV